MILATRDPWILAFSAVTVIATIWMGFWSARKSKTASDFFVAGRSVSVGWNASAISGEYLSAASFMGIAGMVMSSGYDALWYPVCYACGYLFLLLFIAGPLRRFGAYTIPDFAEGRFDSPLFRKIAVCFVLFIGFFYTMPQMKGAGTTLAYIFPGLPYWAGVVLVGAVITLNVALGGMKGITLVQAFQYWAKMFAISVPVFVLMAVYGHYGKHVGRNGNEPQAGSATIAQTRDILDPTKFSVIASGKPGAFNSGPLDSAMSSLGKTLDLPASQTTFENDTVRSALERVAFWSGKPLLVSQDVGTNISLGTWTLTNRGYADLLSGVEVRLRGMGVLLLHAGDSGFYVCPVEQAAAISNALNHLNSTASVLRKPLPEKAPADAAWLSPFGPLTTKAAKAAGISGEAARPFSLLYTYSLIIALVCGTAGLPHILVRFYTNPDGVAAKRTTMWVMILIGIFYVFPPVFGVMGRNLLPELYAGVGAKGTDKVVLELPRILNGQRGKGEREQRGEGTATSGGEITSAPPPPSPSADTNARKTSGDIPWGSILSGITCAGAFAAFMSTFSGLLVSMTGALAHDVYGRMLRPKSTPQQRMRMFRIGAVLLGGGAIIAGSFVEPLQINFMVGQAFAIAAASYFPLLFMSAWWRGMTMKGAATGMLTGGCLALAGITLTSFSDLKWLPLDSFWATHPLLRILCEQPAIWAVPLAITLMGVVSKLTRREIPSDIRMKMLVLHAPEKLGLKQEYIQEHQHGH
jgi:cation/acetate symporter